MPDLKGTVITLHCLIHINVIQLQQDKEYRRTPFRLLIRKDDRQDKCVIIYKSYLHHVLKDI